MGVHSAVGGFTTRPRRGYGPSTARPRFVHGSTTARTRFSRGTVSTSGVQLARPGHGASMRHAFRAAPGESLMVLFGSVESMMIDDGALRWSRSIHRIPTQWTVLIGGRVLVGVYRALGHVRVMMLAAPREPAAVRPALLADVCRRHVVASVFGRTEWLVPELNPDELMPGRLMSVGFANARNGSCVRACA